MAAATKVRPVYPWNYRCLYLTTCQGGVFNLELFLPDDYPMTPPRIRFLTRIYHPNIDRLGRICLDVLKNNWSPALQIRTILLSIQALLGAPNPEDPLNEAVAKQWKVSATLENIKHVSYACSADIQYRRTKQRPLRMQGNGRSCMRSRRSDNRFNHRHQWSW